MAEPGANEVSAVRIGRLCGLLRRFANVMAEQASFHASVRMDFTVGSVAHAAAQAERRHGQVAIAGTRWLLEMEKTMLGELMRGANYAAAVLAEAGAEAWPDLAAVAHEARDALRHAAAEAPWIFAPASFDPASLEAARPAPFEDPAGWKATEPQAFAKVAPGGVLLSVVAWERAGGRSWLAQVGGIGFGLHAAPAAAARHAGAVHAAIFQDRDAEGGPADLACMDEA
jgi:hypothetical protein